jgi:hypothetical protein
LDSLICAETELQTHHPCCLCLNCWEVGVNCLAYSQVAVAQILHDA